MYTGGIGAPELLVIALVSLCLIAIPVATVILIVKLVRKQDPGGKSAADSELAAENQRLRNELTALKNSASP